MILSREPRTHLMWFVHNHFPVDMDLVKEVFIDATYNTARKTPCHIYGIVAEEAGYSIPIGFMLVAILDSEDLEKPQPAKQVQQCNKNFYSKAKELGLNPSIMNTDKDKSQISAAQVNISLIIVLL